MIGHPDGVINLERALARRLRRKAEPLGVEVRTAGTAFAFYGPDRNLYLHPGGVGRDVHWLSYREASETLEHHIAASASGG